MSKIKVKLEEAKKILENEKIFLNGDNKFNYVDTGSYRSGFTIIIPQEWNLDIKEKPESPINFKNVKELTDGMNLDFDGDASVIFGKYRLSQTGKNVFEITPPTKAKDVLVSVSWGGAFQKSAGQDKEYATKANATAFVKRSSHGGGLGQDYWVLPVDYVKDGNKRDVTNILKNLENEEQERINNIDKQLAEIKRVKEESIKNKDRIMEKLSPIVSEIKEYYPSFLFDSQEDHIKYSPPAYGNEYERKYNDELVEEFHQILENEKLLKKQKDELEPKFEEFKDFVKSLGLDIKFKDRYVDLLKNNSEFIWSSVRYSYTETDYNKFIEEINNIKTKTDEQRLENLRKEEELKRKIELDRKKAAAKEKSYPEKFEFRNRLSGLTGLSHAFVIDSDGSIRNPDDNILNNKNHMYHYNGDEWITKADGLQIYDQIYEGEIIVSYTKENSSKPYIINIEWTDGNVNDTQKEVIYSSLEDAILDKDFVIDENGNKIKSFNDWFENSLDEKVRECKKQLNLPEKDNYILNTIKQNINNLNDNIKRSQENENNIGKGNELDKEVKEKLNNYKEKNNRW